MPRPRKSSVPNYRTPTYHKTSHRWRFRIEHAHGEKYFWWPAGADTATCPPEVVAAAVAVQDQWRSLCEEWYWIATAMRIDQPDLDWSRPVWVERAKVDAIVARVEQEQRQVAEADRRQPS